MSHYGILQDYRFEDVQDVRGSEVYGVDNQKLGTVADVIFDHSSGEIRYVVVDAGGWLTSKKFLVPIRRIQPYGAHDDKFYADLDKERIQMLPEFDQTSLQSDAGWADYEKRYHDRWNEGVVMYNKDTGHIVTPPADQVEGGRTEPLTQEGKRSLERDFTPEKLAQQQDAMLGVAASDHDNVKLQPQKPSIGGREDVLLQEQGKTSASEKRFEDATQPIRPLDEPGVYVLDRVPAATETDETSSPGQSSSANQGRRWIDFQKKLREGRHKVVGDCPLCGTHGKAA